MWLGDEGGTELGLVRAAVAGRVDLVAFRTVAEAVHGDEARPPAIVMFAADRPGHWQQAAAVDVARRWPLATLVGVVTSLGDGRRRSGPSLAGMEEVSWHDVPGKLECWLADSARGRAGALGTPATARREERLVDAVAAVVDSARSERGGAVSLAGGRGADLEGLADLLAGAGRRVADSTVGRPRLDASSPLLVWDAVVIEADDVAWLRMLAANRPNLGIVLLESFPRGDSTQAAIRAGAAAVLARPVALDSLEGTLRRVERLGRENRVPTGLGGAVRSR
ncbi:MAG: hypothetical protein EBR28_00525 [Planctomycetia bacterium]|nr:hypothetical protein [Planctomycetia bacterium]